MTTSWSMFLAGSLLLIISPGPDFIYVITQGISRGRWAGMLSALGISTGLLCHTLLAALGLTALIMASPLGFDLARYLGAAYLGYLGVKSWRSQGILAAALSAEGQALEMRSGAILRQGILTNLLNPKALLTFLAFVPQFVTGGDHQAGQVIVLGLSIAIIGGCWFSVVGYCSGMMGEWFANPRSGRIINRVTGCVLIGLGVRLVLLHG